MRRYPLVVLGSLVLSLVGLFSLWTVRAREKERTKLERQPTIATRKIIHVTVYPNSALVNSYVDVAAGQGTIELVVNPLPEHTINSSLYSESSDGIRVLTTRYRTRPVREDTREEVRKLQDEARKLHQIQERIQAEQQALTQNLALLGK